MAYSLIEIPPGIIPFNPLMKGRRFNTNIFLFSFFKC